jgi:transposase
LAELSRRDLVPAIWLPTPTVRAEREQARWRLHLVRHRTALKNRSHATLLAFGHPCPVSDLFGVGGRKLLARLALPEPWAADTAAALHLIDQLDAEITGCERALRRLGADHGAWSPGASGAGRRALDLVGEDLLYVTSANRSRHLTGAPDEPAHCRTRNRRPRRRGS